MRIYNTLTRTKEEFVPLEAGKVKMYACGITVSGEPHIGHGFQALIYDIMRKYFEKKGYKVKYARNYTDVDDKIIAKSKETGIPADIYAAEMIKKTDAIMRAFGVDDPDVWLKATENIGNIIDFVQALIQKGHAYAAASGNVYFDVSSFPAYGCLSNRSVEDMLDGVRVENAEEKRNPADFALWKAAKPGEIFWHSPWGDGRPGWHIECSAMNRAAFGDQIDIHGGGRDLIFPHHENEIAQSESLTGKRFAKYWTHNGLIKVNGQKMSKSLGNSLLLEDLLKKYTNEAIKFALLQTNYRGDINVTDSLFPEAEKHLLSFYKVMDEAVRAGAKLDGECPEIDRAFDAAMDDDFNTAKALADLFGIFRRAAALLREGDVSSANGMLGQVKKTYGLLGLFRTEPAAFAAACEAAHKAAVPEEIAALVKKRAEAKAAKDWAAADALRAEIAAKGWSVKDTKEGPIVEKI